MKPSMKMTCLLALTVVACLVFPNRIVANSTSNATYTVISFDGMRHDLTEDYMEDGTLPNFKKVKENGLFAKDIQTIFPSLTSASHAAIATGARPEKTGMVSNNIHERDTTVRNKQSAFFSPLDATPIWAEARKQEKTTATVLFPGSNPEEGNEATYAVYYGTTWAESALEELTFKQATNWPNLPKSYSPVKEASLSLKLENNTEQKIYLLAADTTNNQTIDYDTFYIYTDKNSSAQAKVHADEWGSISLPIKPSHLAGFSFKFKKIDASLENVALYRTAVTSGVVHGPEGFKKSIEERFGYLPVQEDDQALEKEWITRKEYEEISERFANWTTDVSLYIKEQYQPDLLFYYYPQIDHEEHKYLLVDPRQPGYSSEQSEQYMSYVRWSYELADQVLEDTLEKMNEDDRLFLLSDHGMEPVHTMISPNHALEKANLLTRDKDGKVDVTNSKAYAVASGAIAHIYINLEGREQKGIVSQKAYTKVQQEIVDLFTGMEVQEVPKSSRMHYLFNDWRQNSFKDSVSTFKKMFNVLMGEKEEPFDAILLKGRNGAEILDHERAGDVLLVAKQGYYMAQDEDSIAKKADERGNHGGDPARKELRPVLFVSGRHYPTATIPEKISTIDIAPTLYALLSLRAPDFVDGQVIDAIVEADSK